MKTAVALSLLLAGVSAFHAPVLHKSFVGGSQLRTNGFTLGPNEALIEEGVEQRGPRMDGKSNAIRGRIGSVKNTKKITEAMRLVAAAKVRRAQDAVLSTRPFNEGLGSIFQFLIKRLAMENIDLPLLQDRPAKKVTVVCITGDRGLCGSYNTKIMKLAAKRVSELKKQGLEVEMVTIGNKATGFFKSRENVRRSFGSGAAPSADTASAIADELLSEYLSGEVDRVEFCYTRFVNLITSEPSIRTMLPLKASGIESQQDEIFSMTTKDGNLVGEKTVVQNEPEKISGDVIFEQDPVSILNALLPLYFNGQVLRMLQESVASELGARMQAMQSASDNAEELAGVLTIAYNRARQASITNEICEIVAGANSVDDGGAGSKDKLIEGKQRGDEFELARLAEDYEWLTDLDSFKEILSPYRG